MDNIKAAMRSLRSTPGLSIVVMATLAIAIGANTAIFSVVNGVLLRPLGYGDESHLVVVWANRTEARQDKFRLSPADYRDARDGIDAFGGQFALYRSIGSTLTGLDEPVRVGSLSVTPRLFEVLRAKPELGQFFADEDERPGTGKKVVLTHAAWTRRFGAAPSIIGESVDLDDVPYTIVGVAAEGFTFPPGNDHVELYFPMTLSDGILLDRNHRMFDAVARVQDGAAVETANAQLDTMGARLAEAFPDTNEGWQLSAEPLRDEILGNLSRPLWVLAGAVFLVLLAACANIANLLVARSTVTSREFAVRAALGAGRADLLKRSLAESALLGGLGAFGGVCLAWGGISTLRAVMPPDIIRGTTIRMDGAVLLFALTLSVGSTMLFAFVPALRSMGSDIIALMKPSGAASIRGSGRRVRELLVVSEVALAIMLLVGAGLMARSFARLSAVEPGFRQDGVVSVAVALPRSSYSRSEWRPFFEELVERVERTPGISRAGAVSDLPMANVGLGLELEFTVTGLDALSPTARPNADCRLVIPGYFEAMAMSLVRGRDFDRLDATGSRAVAIVNETLVRRYFEDLDPIGRSIDVATLGDVEIIGVVTDIRHSGLLSNYESEIYLPYGRISTSEMHIVAFSRGDPSASASAVASILSDMNPELAPSEVVRIEELLWQSVSRARFTTALLVGLALSAAILSMIGTYGIVAYSVSQRRVEIGVRMALGASSGKTIARIVFRAARVVLSGTLLGAAGAAVATQFMKELLFQIQPFDPATYAMVMAAALIVGLAAAWAPARRAANIDPVATLRGE